MRTFTTILTGFLATMVVEFFSALVVSITMGKPSLPCAAYTLINLGILSFVVQMDRSERRAT